MTDPRSRQPWFAPKKFGYGAGLPIEWQGWALLIGYCAAALVMGLALPLFAFIAALIVVTIPVLLVARARTEGGWRWREGQ